MKPLSFKPLLLTLAACLLMSAAPAPARAVEATLPPYIVKTAHKDVLRFNVYAGGFQALRAGLSLDVEPGKYTIRLNAETQNFIGDLFPWTGIYKTVGHAQKGQPPLPKMHDASSTWRNTLKTMEMAYDKDGQLEKFTVTQNGQTTVTKDFAPELSLNAVDMLTGTLMMLQTVDQTNACEGAYPVFDGKRRFNITLQSAGTATIAKSKYSIFEGEALKCYLTVEPVAGFKKKDLKRGWMAVQKHTEERQKPPTIWFARLKDGGAMLPVRMEIASAYGMMVAHLISAETP